MQKHITQPVEKLEAFIDLFENISDSLLVVNIIGQIIYLNPKARNLFQYKNSSFDDNLQTLLPGFQYRDGEIMRTIHGLRFNNTLIPVEISTNIIHVDNEEFNVILVKEILEEKNLTEQLRMLNQEVADIKFALDESTIIAITDAKGTITLVNQKFCELSKYSEEELIGQNHRILNSGYHSKEFFQNMWKTIGNGKIWKGEIQNKAKDGSLYWVGTTIVPFMGDNGKPYQYVSVRTDITDKVKMEVELKEAMKNDFISTIKNLQNGIFKMSKTEDGRIVYTIAEGKLMDEIGANTISMFNKTPQEIFPCEMAKIKNYHYTRAFEGNRVNYEIELRGKLVYVDVSPIFEGDDVIEIVGSVHDITELRSTQNELKLNLQHYQSLFEHSQDTVITYNANGEIVDMNPRACEIFGYSIETIPNGSTVDLIVEKYVESRNEYFEKAIKGNPQNFEIEIINQQGERLFLNITFLPIIIENEINGVYSIGKDITNQKKNQELNAYLAHHDELTKLPNRRWIEQKLQDSLLSADENDQLAVMFIDLDRFKKINDTLGHLIGDRLLELISKRLENSLQKGKQFVARMGGDEFMLVYPTVTKQQEVINLANIILQNLTSPFYIEDHELLVSASIGISFYPSAGTSVVDLMKKADIALYRAKDLGRNMYQIYTNSMDERNYQSFLLERDLRKAILNKEFVAYFQPRVNTVTGETVGAEALIRWNHPKFGLISPAEFIPLAEETGLIVHLGKWMKRKVCEQLIAWREEGIPLIPISVNISSQRFLQTDFAKDVRNLLEEYELEGKWLELEITENSLMKNEEYILETLVELKNLGIKIFIDDFGTGYSSFNYLKTFNLDGIKIDRMFIQNISSHSENAGITIAMIKMAQHLKMEVIAEGVETKEELSFLSDQDCQYVQGYYFGKPCSIEEFEKNFKKIEVIV
ncbi:EAL domain-containing protein [Fredinandcohnia sp. 179-A 10B2 NHS]|uniref:EAL domain-containing protein n=1 Tax=Fredinandcohnia sp. 179-A 10B2 NHS TaxID=3235176 RepID=UPI0039A0F962